MKISNFTGYNSTPLKQKMNKLTKNNRQIKLDDNVLWGLTKHQEESPYVDKLLNQYNTEADREILLAILFLDAFEMAFNEGNVTQLNRLKNLSTEQKRQFWRESYRKRNDVTGKKRQSKKGSAK
jgi:hypothetical protein